LGQGREVNCDDDGVGLGGCDLGWERLLGWDSCGLRWR
jgi:hypothetical protein